MHKSQSLFNLIIALHVSGVTITHLQEHKTTASTASGNHYTVLLSAAIVEKLELGRHYHPSSGAQNNCIYSIW
jgi:hypothetical protein